MHPIMKPKSPLPWRYRLARANAPSRLRRKLGHEVVVRGTPRSADRVIRIPWDAIQLPPITEDERFAAEAADLMGVRILEALGLQQYGALAVTLRCESGEFALVDVTYPVMEGQVETLKTVISKYRAMPRTDDPVDPRTAP